MSRLKSAMKPDHMLKLSLPVASRGEPERKPVLPRTRDIPITRSRFPNRRPEHLEERPGAGVGCYAIPNGAGGVVPLVRVASGCAAYLYDAFTFVNDLKDSSIRRCGVWTNRDNGPSLRGLGPVRLCSGEPWV